MKLSWIDPTINLRPNVGYHVKFEKDGTWLQFNVTKRTSLVVKNLRPGMTYTFYAKKNDEPKFVTVSNSTREEGRGPCCRDRAGGWGGGVLAYPIIIMIPNAYAILCLVWENGTQGSYAPWKSCKTLDFYFSLEKPLKPWNFEFIPGNPWEIELGIGSYCT